MGASRFLIHILFVGLIPLALAGCQAANGPENTTPTASPPDTIALPPLDELQREVSTSGELDQNGADYLRSLIYRAVTDNGGRTTFYPGGASFEQTAFAIYRFDASGLSGPHNLLFDWSNVWGYSAAPPNMWVALSEWPRQRWRWFAVGDAAKLPIEAFERYVNPEDGRFYAVLLFTGTTRPELRGLAIDHAPLISAVSPLALTQGVPVTLAAKVTGCGPLAYDWQFGNAALPRSSTDARPVITAPLAGSFPCTVRISNALGETVYAFDLTVQSGVPEWTHSFGQQDNDAVVASVVDAAGNLLVLDDDMQLTAFSPLGERLVSYHYRLSSLSGHTEVCSDLAVDPDGNVYICGTYGCNINGYKDGLFLLRLNSNYEQQWMVAAQDKYRIETGELALDSAGCVWVTAGVMGIGGQGQADVALLKFGPDGDLRMQKTWGGPDIEIGWDIALDKQDNVLVVGRIEHNVTDSGVETCLLQFDKSGALERQRGFPAMTDATLFLPADGAQIYLALNGDNTDAVVALDGDWQVTWSKSYLQGTSSWLTGVLTTADAIYLTGGYLAGETQQYKENLLVKCDQSGNVAWVRGWDCNDFAEGFAAAQPAPGGGLYLTGTAANTSGAWNDLTAGMAVSAGIAAPRELSGIVAEMATDLTTIGFDRLNAAYTWDTGGGGSDALAMLYQP